MKTSDSAPISLLFPPNVLPIIDLFRAFGSSDGHGSMATMDNLEPALAALIGVDAARTAASDILLFSFALRRKRETPLNFGELHARVGTADEYCLLTLLSAAAGMDDRLMHEAVYGLGITGEASLISLAEDIAKSLRFLPFKASFLSADLFEAVLGAKMHLARRSTADLVTGYTKFHFPA
ncbi:MAG: hypothetical protein ABWY78_18580 [Microvirga sp.]